MKGIAIWTALPNGYTADGYPKLAVMVSPRFEDLSGSDPLGPFRDWPAAIGNGQLRFAVRANRGTSVDNLLPLNFQDKAWVTNASGRWGAVLSNYLRSSRPSGKFDLGGITALGAGYRQKTFVDYVLSGYECATLSQFFRRVFREQNASVRLVKSPLDRKEDLDSNGLNVRAVTKLAADLTVRLPPDASEQSKLEAKRAVERFKEWMPADAGSRTGDVRALANEALRSLSRYNHLAEQQELGYDLRPWVLDAAMYSICQKLQLKPPEQGLGLEKATRDLAVKNVNVPLSALAEFASFHAVVDDELYEADAHRDDSAPPDKIDIHSAFSMLGDFPQLERSLGIILDLVLPKDFALGRQGVITASPKWDSPPGGLRHCCMQTHYTVTADATKRFFAAPATEYLKNGFFDLRHKGSFYIETMDVDSSAYSALYGTVRSEQGNVPSTDKALVSAPATAGIGIIFNEKREFLRTLMLRADGNDKSLSQILASPAVVPGEVRVGPELWAEDLLLGVRVDIQTKSEGTWRSVCKRNEVFAFPTAKMSWSPGETVEGEVRLGATQSSTDGTALKTLRLSPSLARWEPNGWSLCAPMPQQPIANTAPATTSPEVPVEERPLALTHEFTVPDTVIPQLPQFLEEYKVRGRFTDVGGNSLSEIDPDDSCSIGNENAFLLYRRFEPLGSPRVVLWAPLKLKQCPARQLSRLVVREEDRIDRRLVVPPRVPYILARAHEKILGRRVFRRLPGAFPGAQLQPDGDFHSIKEVGEAGKPVENPIFLYQPSNATPPESAYLPDPLCRASSLLLTDRRHFAFTRDSNKPAAIRGFESEIGTYFADKTAWPNAQPFVIELHRAERPVEGTAPPTARVSPHSVLAPFTGALRVELLPGETVLLKLASRFDEGTPDQSAVEAMALYDEQTNSLEYVSSGQLPSISPPLELTLVHAVKTPINAQLVSIGPLTTLSCLDPATKVVVRVPESKSVTLEWGCEIHRSSAGRLDLQAEWTEMVDVPTEPNCRIEHHTQILQQHTIELDPEDSQMSPAQLWNTKEAESFRVEQIFNDTHYRLVTFSGKAFTRFRDYYTKSVKPEDEASFAKKLGSITVALPSTKRPIPPLIHSIMPLFPWKDDFGGNTFDRMSRREGGALRVYIERGWYSSGDGEQLAIILLDLDTAPLKLPDEDLRKLLTPVITRWGTDPRWGTEGLPPLPLQSDFREGAKPSCALTLPGFENNTDPKYRFKVVAVTPSFDADRRMWRADVSVDPHFSYTPFFRLALARYQPNAIANCELSPVTLAEFAQLLPDRMASISYDARNDRVVHVTLRGVSYLTRRASNKIVEGPARVRVCVEERAGDVGGELGWHRIANIPKALDGGWLDPDTTTRDAKGGPFEWRFRIEFPSSRKDRHYRVVIKEDEMSDQDDQSQWPQFGGTKEVARPVFLSILGV